jgi:hypothetical protein
MSSVGNSDTILYRVRSSTHDTTLSVISMPEPAISLSYLVSFNVSIS